MVRLASRAGDSPKDWAAVAQLLGLAAGRLETCNAQTLVAFVCCAAAFKGLLQPEQLAAWQEAVVSSGALQDMTSAGVSNALLSLGTLARSDEQLAQQVVQAAAKLMDFRSDPFNMYYNGELFDGLLEFVIEQGAAVRQATQVVGALGTLRHMPRPAAWQRLVSVERDGGSQAAANMILAANAAQLEEVRQRGGRSQFECALAAAVQLLAAGLDVQPVFVAADCDGQPLAVVDVALPLLRIAVEADGPRRFLRGRGASSGGAGQLQLDGPSQARNRLLQGAGWLVVSVPYASAWQPIAMALLPEVESALQALQRERAFEAAPSAERPPLPLAMYAGAVRPALVVCDDSRRTLDAGELAQASQAQKAQLVRLLLAVLKAMPSLERPLAAQLLDKQLSTAALQQFESVANVVIGGVLLSEGLSLPGEVAAALTAAAGMLTGTAAALFESMEAPACRASVCTRCSGAAAQHGVGAETVTRLLTALSSMCSMRHAGPALSDLASGAFAPRRMLPFLRGLTNLLAAAAEDPADDIASCYPAAAYLLRFLLMHPGPGRLQAAIESDRPPTQRLVPELLRCLAAAADGEAGVSSAGGEEAWRAQVRLCNGTAAALVSAPVWKQLQRHIRSSETAALAAISDAAAVLRQLPLQPVAQINEQALLAAHLSATALLSTLLGMLTGRPECSPPPPKVPRPPAVCRAALGGGTSQASTALVVCKQLRLHTHCHTILLATANAPPMAVRSDLLGWQAAADAALRLLPAPAAVAAELAAQPPAAQDKAALRQVAPEAALLLCALHSRYCCLVHWAASGGAQRASMVASGLPMGWPTLASRLSRGFSAAVLLLQAAAEPGTGAELAGPGATHMGPGLDLPSLSTAHLSAMAALLTHLPLCELLQPEVVAALGQAASSAPSLALFSPAWLSLRGAICRMLEAPGLRFGHRVLLLDKLLTPAAETATPLVIADLLTSGLLAAVLREGASEWQRPDNSSPVLRPRV
ncbi:hypothetical protein ABPG75_008688 [Micractinium tetrahymenae]